MTNEEVALRWKKCLEDSDIEAMDRLLAPDATVWHSHDDLVLHWEKARQTERDAVAKGIELVQPKWTNISYHVSDKGAVFEANVRAGDDQTAPVHMVHVLTIKNGKVTNNNVYMAVQSSPWAHAVAEDGVYAGSTVPASKMRTGRPA
jgi:ketosteroid isomerase-like protein